MKVLVVVATLCVVYQQAQTQRLLGSIFNGVGSFVRDKIDGASNVVGHGGPLNHVVDTTFHGVNSVADKVLNRNLCERDLTLQYRISSYNFNAKICNHVAERYGDHFVISPFSIWLSIAGLAEGADDKLQKQLFEALNLPEELCARQKFYQIALSAETPGPDVDLMRKRKLVLDEGLIINDNWASFVKSAGILDVNSGPIRRDPMDYSNKLRQFISAKSNPVLSGNSYIIDSLDYEGLWMYAFPEAKITREPFYDDAGKQVGLVDMMRIKRKVRMTHVPLLNVKVLELPVGNDNRYTMLFTMGMDQTTLRSAIGLFVGKFIVNIMESLQMSLIPIEVAVPRFAIASEFDVRQVLEGVGLGKFWNDPAATRYVSSPPAMPTGYLQRVSVKVGSKGILSTPEENPGLLGFGNMATGFATALGRDFIANRPFMFSLFDAQTRTCLFSGAFSQPSNR